MNNNLEEYYTVSTFSSIAFGPLNKRQTKIRDHFVRAMEFLGLGDVDIDSLSKEQRDEILALTAQRRKEMESSPKSKHATSSGKINAKERASVVNKRQWDIRHNLNIKLYKALDALALVIDDVETLSQEQRGTIYAELKRREAAREQSAQSHAPSYPSEKYEELEKLYKPEPFVDVSALVKLVSKQPTARLQGKSAKRVGYNNQEPIGAIVESRTVPEAKPMAKESRKPTALCPHPYKKTFVTKELALNFIEKAHRNDKTVVPYKCSCGAIHIGHKN